MRAMENAGLKNDEPKNRAGKRQDRAKISRSLKSSFVRPIGALARITIYVLNVQFRDCVNGVWWNCATLWLRYLYSR